MAARPGPCTPGDRSDPSDRIIANRRSSARDPGRPGTPGSGMNLVPPCPDCGHVEWLGDGLLVALDHGAAVARRLVLATQPERCWSCFACWHPVTRPSALHDRLEAIAGEAAEAGYAGNGHVAAPQPAAASGAGGHDRA